MYDHRAIANCAVAYSDSCLIVATLPAQLFSRLASRIHWSLILLNRLNGTNTNHKINIKIPMNWLPMLKYANQKKSAKKI